MYDIDPLTTGLLQLCDDVVARLEPSDARQAVSAVREKLTVPLQVTVGGGVSSGKSTLVNALLGQRVAAVDAGECTKVVTRFCHSHHERVEVILRTGETRTLPLVQGAVPNELGAPASEIREVVAHLSNASLERVNIIDTPGLNTVTEENEETSAGFLGLAAADTAGRATAERIGRADALIFLMPHLRQHDADILAGFRRLYAESGLSAFNAVGVLSRIDQLTRHGDPREAAAPIARRIAAEAQGLVSEVVPMLGLLAETGAAAALDERDARALAQVAAFGDDLDREDLLVSVDAFLAETGLPLDAEQRKKLVDRLDLYGIAVMCEAVDGGAVGALPLLQRLVEISGLARLRDVVFGRLGGQASLIKATAAIGELRRLSYRLTDGPVGGAVMGQLRSDLERLDFDPSLHRLRVVGVLQDAASGAFRIPESLLRDVERLAAHSDPEARSGAATLREVPEAATAGATRWARFANDPRRNPADAHRARIVKEAYEHIWQQAAESLGGAW